MRPQTQELRNRIQQTADLQQQVDLLAGAYQGEAAYLLACGPSLNSVWSDRAEHFLRDKLVIAVKQAYEQVPGSADFHLLNPWNYQPYEYAEPAPIVAASRAPDDPDTPGMKADLLFPVPDPRNYAERLATTWHFDRWLLSQSHDRPWGPGVVYELGIYLLVHLGVSHIVTLGWDLGERNSPVMEHFFEEAEPGSGEDDGILNKPQVRSFEVDDIATSTRALYYWLRSKGISLDAVSDRSLVDGAVPRISLFDEPGSHERHQIELVANGDFGDRHGSLAFWQVEPSVEQVGLSRASNERDGAVQLLPDPDHVKTVISQTVPVDRYFEEGTIRARLRGLANEPGRLTLAVAVASGPDSEPLVARVDHPGDGSWRSIDLEMRLPASFVPRLVKISAMLRGDAKEPAQVERVTAILER